MPTWRSHGLCSCDRLTHKLGKKPHALGRSQVGKAAGFGPAIPGSNPGAPAISRRVTESPLAAVVLAAGLGTRMRSEKPKHLHPLLGRRLVDWVLEAVRELDPQ